MKASLWKAIKSRLVDRKFRKSRKPGKKLKIGSVALFGFPRPPLKSPGFPCPRGLSYMAFTTLPFLLAWTDMSFQALYTSWIDLMASDRWATCGGPQKEP